jgi:uroporphyrinogen-III synthase
MTLAGRRIALTRPEPGALGDRLTTLGAQVVHVPLIAIDDPADGGAALRRALARLRSFDWLVVTSANGARRAGPAARDQPTVRLAAVGRATAGALADAAGRPVDLVPAVERADGLLAAFPAAPSRVLVAQADRASRALADGLSAAGHTVEVVVAYRTVERAPTADESDALATVDAVVLSSGSAASAYASSVGTAARPLIVTIGPVTAGAARRCGLTVAEVAPSPDPDTLVRILASTL